MINSFAVDHVQMLFKLRNTTLFVNRVIELEWLKNQSSWLRPPKIHNSTQFEFRSMEDNISQASWFGHTFTLETLGSGKVKSILDNHESAEFISSFTSMITSMMKYSMKVQYNSLTMSVSVYARIWSYLVTCVLYFRSNNQ
jgi:hypothetical protein